MSSFLLGSLACVAGLDVVFYILGYFRSPVVPVLELYGLDLSHMAYYKYIIVSVYDLFSSKTRDYPLVAL